jgi:hypothetical protein
MNFDPILAIAAILFPANRAIPLNPMPKRVLKPMTSRMNAKLSQPVPNPNTPSPGQATYAPSVPISIYRQVSTELECAQTVMDSLKTQNQQLVEQNQQLRLEIERVVQSTLQLRQVADAYKPLQPSGETAESNLELHFEAPPAPPMPPAQAMGLHASFAEIDPSVPRNLSRKATADGIDTTKPVIEQEARPRRSAASERTQEVGGWWLVLIILLIVVTAFGTGFLIVRPLLPNR